MAIRIENKSSLQQLTENPETLKRPATSLFTLIHIDFHKLNLEKIYWVEKLPYAHLRIVF
jgi:hypothetical protein